MRVLVLAALALLAVSSGDPTDGITAAGIRGHLYFLSHDALEGRGTGTRGGDLAAEYIAAQFTRAGLRPVDGSYVQAVPLRGVRTDLDLSSLAFVGQTDTLAAGLPDRAVVWTHARRPDPEVVGELVFVGYGIHAPAWDWDDFEGRNLAGGILVVLVGEPPAPPDEPDLFDGRALTYYGRWSYKIEEAARRGAAGVLLIHDPETAAYGWGAVASSWTGEQFVLDDTAALPPPPLQGWLADGLAREVLARADLDLDELMVRAARRDFRPVATGITARARLSTETRRFTDHNVVGWLPGRHVSRRDEVVVFTAHYDHLGIGRPSADGDSIYNGAYDNASGVAVLLEVAAAFAARDTATERSLLFIATAAEEAGLLGATHYVRNPVFPPGRTVAALNVDGANLWGETDDLIVVGADRSGLAAALRARGEAMGIEVRDDPTPENGAFFRSDHFAFARAGVPAVGVSHGQRFRDRPPDWGARTMADLGARIYHQPIDEYDPAFDLRGAVQQARFLFGVGLDLATGPRQPVVTGEPAGYSPVGRSRNTQGSP